MDVLGHRRNHGAQRSDQRTDRLVFPLGTIFLFLLLTGRLRHLFKLRLVSSFLVFLVIAAPWHLLAGFRNPAQGQAKGFSGFILSTNIFCAI